MEFNSPILSKYKLEIEKVYGRILGWTPKSKSKKQKSLVFDDGLFTSTKITIICTILSPIDLILYLKEIGFIIDSNIVCGNCNSSSYLSLINKCDQLDSYLYKCNNKILLEDGDELPKKKDC